MAEIDPFDLCDDPCLPWRGLGVSALTCQRDVYIAGTTTGTAWPQPEWQKKIQLYVWRHPRARTNVWKEKGIDITSIPENVSRCSLLRVARTYSKLRMRLTFFDRLIVSMTYFYNTGVSNRDVRVLLSLRLACSYYSNLIIMVLLKMAEKRLELKNLGSYRLLRRRLQIGRCQRS